MAKDARELMDDDRSLAGMAQDMREASRSLDGKPVSQGELLVALSRLESLIEVQTESSRRLEETLALVPRQMDEILTKAKELCGTTAEDRAKMQDAVMGGLMEAHSIATEHALAEISKVAEEARKQIKALEKQAEARAARYKRVLLPDRLFQACKWLLVLLGLAVAVCALFHLAI